MVRPAAVAVDPKLDSCNSDRCNLTTHQAPVTPLSPRQKYHRRSPALLPATSFPAASLAPPVPVMVMSAFPPPVPAAAARPASLPAAAPSALAIPAVPVAVFFAIPVPVSAA